MLQSKGSERVGHDLATEQQQQQMRGGGQVGSGSRPAQGQSDGGRNQEHALPGRKVTPKGKEQNEEIHPHGKWSSVKISGDLVWEKRERRGKEGEGEGWKKEKKKQQNKGTTQFPATRGNLGSPTLSRSLLELQHTPAARMQSRAR